MARNSTTKTDSRTVPREDFLLAGARSPSCASSWRAAGSPRPKPARSISTTSTELSPADNRGAVRSRDDVKCFSNSGWPSLQGHKMAR